MKSAVETLNPTRAKLTVEVPWADLQSSLDAAYQAIAKQVNVPGFRKGKVPPAVIDRQVGRGAVLDQAINDALPEFYGQALRENELVPLAQPEIDITRLEDNDVLEFTAEVDVRPQITLPEYDSVAVEVDAIEVSDDEVTERIDQLRERFATLQEVERAAADGDIVTVDLVASADGEVVEGGELSGYSYKVGSGQLLEGADEAITGLSAGESAEFTSTLAGGDKEGEEVTVKVTVSVVKEQDLPEVDDDFAQTASEFDTLEELRADLTTQVENSKRLEQAAAARDAILSALLDQTEIPLPDAVVESELAHRRQEMEQQLAWAGMTLDQYLDGQKQTVDEFEGELAERVREAIASQFLLDEIVKAEELTVEQDELSRHLFRRAQESGQNPDEYIKHILEHNHVPEMVAEVVRGKAMAFLVDSAKITDSKGAEVDLKGLQADGSIAEPTDEAADADDEAADTAEGDAGDSAADSDGEDTSKSE